jgi:hypothetical protein
MLPVSGDWNDILRSQPRNKAKAFFEENRPEFEFQARLALSKTANEYTKTYYAFRRRLPGLFEFDGGYYYPVLKEKKDDESVFAVRVSNFTLDVDHYQLSMASPEEPVYRYHLSVKPKQGRPISFTVPAVDLASSSTLTSMFMTRARVLWEGDRRASMALAKRIVETKSPVVKQLQTVGFDDESGCYVFRDFMIDKKGKTVLPDKKGFFRLSHSTYLRPAQYNTIRPENGVWPKQIHSLITGAWNERGAVAIAWMVASWFVNEIKNRLGFFPFLSFWGDTQCGKSCLARVLNACQCIDEEGLPMRKVNTGKGEIRKLAQRSNLFQALLEGNQGDNFRLDMDNILTWYNDTPLQVRALKTNDIQTQEIPFRSSLLFVQNTEPFRTKAQKERVLSLEFKQEYQSPETAESFNNLMKIPVSKFPAIFQHIMMHRLKIEKEWENRFESYRKRLSEAVNDPRIQENHALVLAFHDLLSEIIGGINDLEPFIHQMAIRRHKECTHRPADIADFFFDIVFDLHRENKDISDQIIDFRKEDQELWIYLKGVWHEAENKKYPIRASLREVQAALREHPAYIDSNRAHRFRNGATVETKKAWVFDTTKISGDIEDMLT